MVISRFKKAIFIVLIISTFLFVAACGNSTTGGEDDFPNKNIRFIVAAGAGGGFDTTARQIQPYFEKALGTKIAVENREGGNTAIGTTLVAEGAADGYTILVSATPHLQFSTIDENVKYDHEDLYPIGSLTFEPGVIRVRDDSPFNDLNDLIEYARANGPKSLTASVPFLAGNNFLALKQLEEATGVEFNIVPFGGGADARNALLGGQVDFTHGGVFNSLAIAEGTKVIGVQYSSNDWKELTDNAKTFNEQLGTNIPDSFSTYGMWVSAKLVEEHPERYAKLVAAMKEAADDPDYKEALEKLGEWDKVRYIAPEEYHEINRELLQSIKDVEHLLDGE